jgi:hypothetical protein
MYIHSGDRITEDSVCFLIQCYWLGVVVCCFSIPYGPVLVYCIVIWRPLRIAQGSPCMGLPPLMYYQHQCKWCRLHIASANIPILATKKKIVKLSWTKIIFNLKLADCPQGYFGDKCTLPWLIIWMLQGGERLCTGMPHLQQCRQKKKLSDSTHREMRWKMRHHWDIGQRSKPGRPGHAWKQEIITHSWVPYIGKGLSVGWYIIMTLLVSSPQSLSHDTSKKNET